MGHRIHLFGASGSGTTTLGAVLAAAIDGAHLDTDNYYWHQTDPPFTTKRLISERIVLIEHDIATASNWVLTGSLCSWGDPLLDHFSLAVFLQLDPETRIRRLLARERRRHGERIAPGGDMYEQHEAFIAWARSYDTAREPIRSLDMHERWITSLPCPVMRLSSLHSPEQLTEQIMARLA